MSKPKVGEKLNFIVSKKIGSDILQSYLRGAVKSYRKGIVKVELDKGSAQMFGESFIDIPIEDYERLMEGQ